MSSNESIFPTKLQEIKCNDRSTAYTYPSDIAGKSGLTKRELFAAMAMQGFCASSGAWEEWNANRVAEIATEYADKLIIALEKGESK